jgi:hypothetical protein
MILSHIGKKRDILKQIMKFHPHGSDRRSDCQFHCMRNLSYVPIINENYISSFNTLPAGSETEFRRMFIVVSDTIHLQPHQI